MTNDAVCCREARLSAANCGPPLRPSWVAWPPITVEPEFRHRRVARGWRSDPSTPASRPGRHVPPHTGSGVAASFRTNAFFEWRVASGQSTIRDAHRGRNQVFSWWRNRRKRTDLNEIAMLHDMPPQVLRAEDLPTSRRENLSLAKFWELMDRWKFPTKRATRIYRRGSHAESLIGPTNVGSAGQ
jgi:hypothetical protein